MSSPQYETSITHRNNIASGLKVFWVRSTGTGDNAMTLVCYSDGSRWLFDNGGDERLTVLGELLQSNSGAIISLRNDRLEIFLGREPWLRSLSSDTAKLQPKAERQVRFVWNIGAAQDEFKDLPEQGGGYADLYDRQEKEVVMRIHHKYGQLLCLETTKPNDAPFTALAEWLNAIDNDTLKSEGIPISRPPFAPPLDATAKQVVVFTGRLVGTCESKEIRLDIESIESAGVTGVDPETGDFMVNTRDGKQYVSRTPLQFQFQPAL